MLLELLVSNGGKPLAPLYDDSKLIERLRIMISDDHVIPRVRKKLIAMVIGWKQEFAADPQYAKLVALNKYASAYYKPNRAAATRQVPQFMNDSADEFSDSELGSISSRPVRRHNNALGSSNKDLDTQYEIPAIDISKAGPEIEKIISQAGTNATILKNELASLNRGNGELAVDNDRCSLNFEKCRQIRRKVLRYLQVVNEGHYLGLLIHANDELVDALQMYSDYSKPEDATTTRSNGFLDETEEPESVATRLSDEELYNYESSEDENNPFTDNHKVAED